jgi:hypothetical protein
LEKVHGWLGAVFQNAPRQCCHAAIHRIADWRVSHACGGELSFLRNRLSLNGARLGQKVPLKALEKAPKYPVKPAKRL